MSAQAVETEILAPMQRQFYPPKKDMPAAEQQAALRDYVAALQGFDALDLKTAWADVCGTHTKPAWPLPAVFAAAARSARKARLPAEIISRQDRDKLGSGQRWETWVKVCRSRLAFEACEKQVAWALKCAILTDGKKPEEINLREMARAKANAERTADMIGRGDAVPHFRDPNRLVQFTAINAKVALDLWQRILVKEAETQAEINYGRAAKEAAE